MEGDYEMAMTARPSPAAAEKAEKIMAWYPLSTVRGTFEEDGPEFDEQWRLAVAREFDAFAATERAATWEAAAACLDGAATTPVLVTDAYNIAAVAEIRAMLHAMADGFRARAAPAVERTDAPAERGQL
jgi:hypothetical protein